MLKSKVELPFVLRKFRKDIEAELKKAVAQKDSPLYPMLAYHMGWQDEAGQATEGGGGKLIRPTLCLLACQAAGGDYHKALPAALALELLHNFSLIHDDIEDESPYRRGRPTVWRIWGPAQAINAGDALATLARLALLQLRERGIAEETVMEAVHILDKASLSLCQGQSLDLAYQERPWITLAEYLAMVEGKTAALFSCSLELGAMVAGSLPEVRSHFSRAGHSLGLAFQIKDDLLGIWGEEKATGKPSRADILSRKKTFPIVYALERAGEDEREQLQALYHKPSLNADDVSWVISLLEKLGARRYTEGQMEHYYREALGFLREPKLHPSSLSELLQAASFLIERDF